MKKKVKEEKLNEVKTKKLQLKIIKTITKRKLNDVCIVFPIRI